jgi:hypothetical protein
VIGGVRVVVIGVHVKGFDPQERHVSDRFVLNLHPG